MTNEIGSNIDPRGTPNLHLYETIKCVLQEAFQIRIDHYYQRYIYVIFNISLFIMITWTRKDINL